MSPQRISVLDQAFGIPYASTFGKYLGFPIWDGSLKNSDLQFTLEKVKVSLVVGQ